MKIKDTFYILLAGLLPWGVMGCASQKMGDKVRVTPSDQVLMPDSTHAVQLDMTVEVPRKNLGKRSRLIIVPQLLVGDSLVAECTPMVLDAPIYGKKMHRRVLLEDYVDSLASYARPVQKKESVTIAYTERVAIPDSLASARIVGVVTTDGCGACTAIDTLDMAQISNPITLVDAHKELKLNWIEPQFVVRPKILQARGEASLQFVISKYDINLNMANNRSEMQHMLDKLQAILGDSLAMVNSVNIQGLASVDGSHAFNERLAKQRAESAKNWMLGKVDLSKVHREQFTVGSRPEGWEPVIQAMTADGHADSVRVREIVEKYKDQSDDVAERYIRRLSCWGDIKKNYLQSNRKVEYVYTYSLKSFTTDSELLDMYGKRPDAFNEDELLRVSTLKQMPSEKQEVYRTLMHYFPQSQVAANNLAVLLLNEGRLDEAEAVLESLDDYTPEVLNTRAALYVYHYDYERAIELLHSHMDTPEARYNLGLINAQLRNLGEAYNLMRDYADTNSAIVALSVNRNEEADDMMHRCEDVSPLAEYVRALIAVRLNRSDDAVKHLQRACADASLKERARTEVEFRNLVWNE